MHSQIRPYVNAFIFWCMAFCTGGRIFPHYRWLSGTIIRRILSSALLEKRTFVFALRKEKMFQSSVKGRFKNRSPALKWTEILKKKIKKRNHSSFPLLAGLENACFWRFLSPWSRGGALLSASKWLICPQTHQSISSQSRSACADISWGNRYLRGPERHCEFTSRGVQFSPLPAADTQVTVCRHHLKSSPGP